MQGSQEGLSRQPYLQTGGFQHTRENKMVPTPCGGEDGGRHTNSKPLHAAAAASNPT